MSLVVGAVSLVVVLLLVYVTKCQRFWKDRGVPSTAPKTFLGDTWQNALGTKHISLVFDDIYKAFPNEPFVGLYQFLQPQLLLRDPRLIESVMIKDFYSFTDRLAIEDVDRSLFFHNLFFLKGRRWKDLRSKLVTTFSANKMKLMLPTMDRCARIMDSLIDQQCEHEAVDMKELICRFATDVVGSCIFGLQFNTLNEPESEYRKIGKSLFQPNLTFFLIGVLRSIAPKVVALLKLPELPARVERFFDDLLRQSEQFRRTESVRRNDLMQLMLDIRDRDRDRDREQTPAATNVDHGTDGSLTVGISASVSFHLQPILWPSICCGAFYSPAARLPISAVLVDDVVVLSNMFLFYGAGFETTASTLTFCLHELALHPEIQERLRDEVQMISEAHEGGLNYDALKKMTYADMVISETLRKYPAAGLLFRICTSAYQLPATSHKLAPATQLIIPVHSLHHDRRYYPDPHKFDPQRFTPANVAARPPFTYMPFGDGPRICIAIRFAKMEMKICLFHILSKYEFSPCPKTEIPIKINPRSFVLSSKNGIFLRVRKRV